MLRLSEQYTVLVEQVEVVVLVGAVGLCVSSQWGDNSRLSTEDCLLLLHCSVWHGNMLHLLMLQALHCLAQICVLSAMRRHAASNATSNPYTAGACRQIASSQVMQPFDSHSRSYI